VKKIDSVIVFLVCGFDFCFQGSGHFFIFSVLILIFELHITVNVTLGQNFAQKITKKKQVQICGAWNYMTTKWVEQEFLVIGKHHSTIQYTFSIPDIIIVKTNLTILNNQIFHGRHISIITSPQLKTNFDKKTKINGLVFSIFILGFLPYYNIFRALTTQQAPASLNQKTQKQHKLVPYYIYNFVTIHCVVEVKMESKSSELKTSDAGMSGAVDDTITGCRTNDMWNHVIFLTHMANTRGHAFLYCP
ncbi:hypothetical protein ACJX0J_035872, partial [Zea mays]